MPPLYDRLKPDPIAELKKLGVTLAPKGGLGEPHNEITQEDFLIALANPASALEATLFDHVWLNPYTKNEVRYDVHYYVWPAKVLAITTRYMARALWDGTGYWLWQDENHTGRLDFGFQAVYYRVGCTHPNILVERLPLSMKRVTCPECGYITELSTDD